MRICQSILFTQTTFLCRYKWGKKKNGHDCELFTASKAVRFYLDVFKYIYLQLFGKKHVLE